MVNKRLFKNVGIVKSVPPTNCINEAGAPAYKFGDKHALAQYAVTGTFNSVYYADESTQLKQVEELCHKVDSEFLAKLAVYARTNGKMKDMPAYFAATLAARGETVLLSQIFDTVCNNTKMLSNFVQLIRSGALGRRSFGTAVKRCVQKWIVNRPSKYLFNSSIGHEPSLKDIIKMVHPRPKDKYQEHLFAYLIDNKKYDEDMLPMDVQIFERLKRGETDVVPNVPFRCLTNCGLTPKQWESVALNMTWDTLRQNLNQLGRKGIFQSREFTEKICAKLSDAESVRKSLVFPYQLIVTIKNLDSVVVPREVGIALQEALEVTKENVPVLPGRSLVAVDVSGSMCTCGVMGCGTGQTTPVEVAALMASIYLSQNRSTIVLPFDTSIRSVSLNPFDSIYTNIRKLSLNGGGTNLGCVFDWLNGSREKFDQIIVLSDNQSWLDNYPGNAAPNLGWAKYADKNRNTKLILIDLAPYANTKICDKPGQVLNVGGFSSESIFGIINNFCTNNSQNFVEIIESTKIN